MWVTALELLDWLWNLPQFHPERRQPQTSAVLYDLEENNQGGLVESAATLCLYT